MVKINYMELHFDHIVSFSREHTLFACCRENNSGRTRLFLIFGKEQGHVYTRNGATENWEVLGDFEAELIREKIRKANQRGITTYKFTGSSTSLTGKAVPVAG